jgi:hypothetical protein
MKRRNLKPDELNLWDKVAKTAVPLVPAKKRVTSSVEKIKKKPAPKREIG